MIQFLIAFTGITALLLLDAQSIRFKEWAGFVGLIGQPFWMYTAYQNDQWGIFVLSIIYALVWIRSIRKYWSFDGKQIRRI